MDLNNLSSPDSSWANRPNSEDILAALEHWFPNHGVGGTIAKGSGIGNAGAEDTPGLQLAGDSSISTSIKWTRGEFIGKGSVGRVYLAMNNATRRIMAVKQVELDAAKVITDRLKHQTEVLQDLNHPNIVGYLGLEETSISLSLFMEYVPGGSIASIAKKYGRFSEDVIKSFTTQTLTGLEFLHSKGIVHRDIKGANILVNLDGVCKISDPVCSMRAENVVEENTVIQGMQGTVFWMAPEVVNAGQRGYNSKVDIWSVGCVMLEMWTGGERPWREYEAMAVIVKLYSRGQAPPVPKDMMLDDAAEDFRKACFALNPEERPSGAELKTHPYLVLPPDWTFTGFTRGNDAVGEVAQD